MANGQQALPDKVRQKVGDRYVGTDQALISQFELTLTHELGHTFADAHPAAFEKFKTAAGWQEVTKDALTADGVKADQLAYLEQHRSDPNDAHAHTYGKRRTYSPNLMPDTNETKPYWAVDQSAIPEGTDWSYARVNPQEHFAEAYEMAVQDPARFHRQHITEPKDQARAARDAVTETKRQLATIPDTAANKDRIEILRARLARKEAEVVSSERSIEQLGAQYGVMRKDVFGGDQEAKQAASRLRTRNLDKTRIEEFERRAAELTTPEQIRTLEAQFR